MAQTGVCLLALAGFDLETGLDHVTGRCKIGSGHTGDRTGGEELDDTELVRSGFSEEVGFKVGVCREVDGGERDITEQTSAGALVQTDQTQVLDNPKRGAARSSLDGLGDLTLNLQANLDDFQGVGENLSC